jgi:DNA-binding NarL/FixJ family response regulator
VRLLIVDDHAILRLGIRAILEIESDFRVVAEAGDANEALQRLSDTPVDVVLLDLALPGRSGVDLLPELQQRFPHTRALVLTGHSGEEYVRSCLSAGASGYVLKSSGRSELLNAIRAVHRGERFLCSEVAAQIVRGYLSETEPRKVPASIDLITQRERDVLTLVASGKQNKAIAQQLGLSVKTVRTHRQNLMRKLSLHNAAALTAFAIGSGLLSSAS